MGRRRLDRASQGVLGVVVGRRQVRVVDESDDRLPLLRMSRASARTFSSLTGVDCTGNSSGF